MYYIFTYIPMTDLESGIPDLGTTGNISQCRTRWPSAVGADILTGWKGVIILSNEGMFEKMKSFRGVNRDNPFPFDKLVAGHNSISSERVDIIVAMQCTLYGCVMTMSHKSGLC